MKKPNSIIRTKLLVTGSGKVGKWARHESRK
jgi:hypothetical protein